MEDDNAYKCPSELEEFAKDNGYCGVFRASAKKDVNVKESMEFLIKDICFVVNPLSRNSFGVFLYLFFNMILSCL